MSINLAKLLKESIFRMKRTKMVCTIGPGSDDVKVISDLLKNGMNVARINFSHDDHEVHHKKLLRIREAIKTSPWYANTAIMLDTKGPEIRTGLLEGPKIDLKKGQRIELTSDYSLKATSVLLPLSYDHLARDLKVGSRVLIADGNLSLRVVEINQARKTVLAEAQNDFVLGERKNVNLPGVKVDLPVISEKDRHDLIDFGLKYDVDMVALSFARSKNCIQMCKDTLGEKGKHIKIIPKIENQEGLENLDEIMRVSDGVMIARGDLGMEMEPSKLFIAQNYITEIGRKHGKPIIMATQMLESMTSNSRPTRAEITDVGSAVWNQIDCTMLSGETGNGKFPVESVKIMSEICSETELHFDYKSNFEKTKKMFNQPNFEWVHKALDSSFAADSQVIIVNAKSDEMVKYISALRPSATIFWGSEDARALRGMQIQYGVYGVHHAGVSTITEQELVTKVTSLFDLIGESDYVKNATIIDEVSKSSKIL